MPQNRKIRRFKTFMPPKLETHQPHGITPPNGLKTAKLATRKKTCIFLKKSLQNIWIFRINAVSLHRDSGVNHSGRHSAAPKN